VGGYTTESAVMRGQCDVRPTVTFLAAEHCHCPWSVLISRPTEGRRLCWPERLVTYENGIPANGLLSQY